MILRIPEAIYINRNLRPKDDPQEVEVELVDNTLSFGFNDGAINLYLTLDEMRAIMRLFDAPGGDS